MLHRLSTIKGFHLHATDGEIGHVDDFLIDQTTWAVQYLIVDTSNWIGGKTVVISPAALRGIDWGNARLDVDLTRAQIQASPQLESMDLPPSEVWPPTAFVIF